LPELGDAQLGNEWLDYRARGIGPEHVPDLLRLAREWVTADEDEVEEDELWAPMHAWRALGQLRAAEAVEPLLEIVRLDLERDGDFASEEMPDVFGLIGPPALPLLAVTLRDARLDVYVRWNAATALEKIGERHSEIRGECVALLVEQLRAGGEGEDVATLKGAVVSDLVDLKAVEAALAIQRAFEAGEIDESRVGDWEEVRYRLGLGPRPAPDRPRGSWVLERPETPARTPKNRAQERSRNKRKMAKQSKKKNRKKKK
jgi:hypothetical protein